MAVYQKQVRLPDGCGLNLTEPYLYNAYLHDPEKGFFTIRHQRVCLACKTLGLMDDDGTFKCPKCEKVHTSNLTAPRAYNRMLLLAGRGGGKTLAGAHAARMEMMIPNSI